jgi:hypothetical protein
MISMVNSLPGCAPDITMVTDNLNKDNDTKIAYQCIHRELAALDNRVAQGWAMTSYQKALHKLLASVALVFDADGVKAAGGMLYAVGGHAEMYKALQVWMPTTLHRQIDYAWNGIGEWLC